MAWRLALIQIEKAAWWAEKNDPEIYERLLWSINKINSTHEQATLEPKAQKSSVTIIKKKSKTPRGSARIDFTKPTKLVSGTFSCDLCKKRHLGCRACVTKGGSNITICGDCFSKQKALIDWKLGINKHEDALDISMPGSYGSGKKR